jgi:hypothetical protein
MSAKCRVITILALSLCVCVRANNALTVVIPNDADKVVHTAAGELSVYAGKVFSLPVKIVPENQWDNSACAVYLGNTSFAATNGIDFTSFEEEEWLCREVNSSLVIGGGGRRGALYGVYHYLEDELGIHWFSPAAEFVPAGKELSFAGVDRRGRPAMRYRDIYFVSGPNATAFLARNRMNTESAAYGGQMRYSRAGSCHTLYRYLGTPREVRSLFAAHPDWFPLIDGRRTLDPKANSASKTQLCLTHPGLRAYFVQKLRQHIAADRKAALRSGILPPMYYAVDQNDCYDGFCRCEKCAAIIEREGGTAGLLLDFTNHLAQELEQDAPEATFQMMAYFSTEVPPRYLRPRKNVGIRLCDPRSDLTKTWREQSDQWTLRNLEAWSKICQKIAVWDYQITFGSSSCVSLPTPNEHTFSADLRLLAANGGDGVFFEHEEPIGADMRDLKVWLEMKLLENPNLDAQRLIECFTDGFYGAAGKHIRRARQLLEKAVKAKNARIVWFPSVSAYDFIDEAVVRSLTAEFDAAEIAVAGDNEKLERVNHARLSLDKLLIVRGDSSAVERYRSTWECEMARRFAKNPARSGYKKNVDAFLKIAVMRNSPPLPPRFAGILPSRLHLFPAGRGTFNGEYMQAISDESSPMLEAVRFVLNAVKDRHPELASSFNWPFLSTVNSCADGKDMTFSATSSFKTTPSGYHWYKMAGDVPLTKDSVFSIFSSYSLPIGSAAANAGNGKFDIYASLRILKEDVIKNGKATGDAIYLLDQIAVVQVDK